MHQVPSAPDTAVLIGDFDAFSAEELFEHFVQPSLLLKWWPKEAEVDARVGGKYVLGWPDQKWYLRGEFTALDPGRHLGLTWAWDHEPPEAAQQVDLWFERIHDLGTRLGVFHGRFEASEAGRAARQGVVEGWIHFSMQLAGLRTGAVD